MKIALKVRTPREVQELNFFKKYSENKNYSTRLQIHFREKSISPYQMVPVMRKASSM